MDSIIFPSYLFMHNICLRVALKHLGKIWYFKILLSFTDIYFHMALSITETPSFYFVGNRFIITGWGWGLVVFNLFITSGHVRCYIVCQINSRGKATFNIQCLTYYCCATCRHNCPCFPHVIYSDESAGFTNFQRGRQCQWQLNKSKSLSPLNIYQL